MELVLFTAPCSGNEKNCSYPIRAVITDADGLLNAIRKDHVCAAYKGNYRSSSNFEESTVEVMDCDNDHSDDPDDWVTKETIEELFPDVAYALVPSRHNGMPKDGCSARPRFHVYFLIRNITDEKQYAGLKRGIQENYPFFDPNAMDSARFIYGSDASEVVWHEGRRTIDELVPVIQDEDSLNLPTSSKEGTSKTGSKAERNVEGETVSGRIPAGRRNNTLSRFAGRVVKRFGVTEKAHGIFLEQAAKCDPPLPDDEIRSIWNSASKFGNKVTGQNGYVPPESYNPDFGSEKGSLRPADFSDIGQARVLSAEYGDELRFSEQTGFLHYDGVRWEPSSSAAIGAAEEFLDLQLQDATDELDTAKKALIDGGVPEDVIASGGKKLEKACDENATKLLMQYLQAKAYYAFVMQRRNMRYVTSAMQAAQPMVHIAYEDLDKDPFLLNTPKATYDLRKGLSSRREHRAEDYLTKVTLVDPGDEGRDLWEETLQKTFLGDQELIDYVQAVMGLAAIGHVYVEALIIAYGDGHNGKSTFFNSVARVLGSYSGSISADTLTVGVRRNTKWEITELKGKRLAIAAELEEGQRLSTSVLKQITSTDKIQGEKKFKDPGEFTPSHTVVLYTNHLPRVGASDSGTWRRLIVIPFNASFTGKSDVKNYADFLVEHAGPAILSWIIEGAMKVITVGYHLARPTVVQNAIDDYKASNDWMTAFLTDCCEVDPSYHVKSSELYSEYRMYCERMGEFARNNAEFVTELLNRGFTKKKTKKCNLILGLQISSEFMTE